MILITNTSGLHQRGFNMHPRMKKQKENMKNKESIESMDESVVKRIGKELGAQYSDLYRNSLIRKGAKKLFGN